MLTEKDFLETQLPNLVEVENVSNDMIHLLESKYNVEPFASFMEVLRDLCTFDLIATNLRIMIEKGHLTLKQFERDIIELQHIGKSLKNIIELGENLKGGNTSFDDFIDKLKDHWMVYMIEVRLLLINIGAFMEKSGVQYD